MGAACFAVPAAAVAASAAREEEESMVGGVGVQQTATPQADEEDNKRGREDGVVCMVLAGLAIKVGGCKQEFSCFRLTNKSARHGQWPLATIGDGLACGAADVTGLRDTGLV